MLLSIFLFSSRSTNSLAFAMSDMTVFYVKPRLTNVNDIRHVFMVNASIVLVIICVNVNRNGVVRIVQSC